MRSGCTNKWKQTVTESGPSAEGCERLSRSTARRRCGPIRSFGVRVCEKSCTLELRLASADPVLDAHCRGDGLHEVAGEQCESLNNGHSPYPSPLAERFPHRSGS